jgi:ABC-type antimicrobial peptide transport system permease subunit
LLGVAITMLVRSQLYDISTVEWAVLVPVSVGMVGISLLVAYLSARPWLRVDPMEAVRHS